MNLVLVGYRGTGKSAIARKLGTLLVRPVVSLDEEIVRAAGLPIPELVAASGWNHFRDLEERVCREFGAKGERIGAMAVPTGPGNLDLQCEFLVDLQSTVYCCTASMGRPAVRRYTSWITEPNSSMATTLVETEPMSRPR